MFTNRSDFQSAPRLSLDDGADVQPPAFQGFRFCFSLLALEKSVNNQVQAVKGDSGSSRPFVTWWAAGCPGRPSLQPELHN